MNRDTIKHYVAITESKYTKRRDIRDCYIILSDQSPVKEAKKELQRSYPAEKVLEIKPVRNDLAFGYCLKNKMVPVHTKSKESFEKKFKFFVDVCGANFSEKYLLKRKEFAVVVYNQEGNVVTYINDKGCGKKELSVFKSLRKATTMANGYNKCHRKTIAKVEPITD